MKNKDSGGPAFPFSTGGMYQPHVDGMSRRDYFAAKALQALIQRDGDDTAYGPNLVVGRPILAYEYADAMLEQASK